MENYRCCVIRDGHEVYELRDHLTPVELAHVEEREKSSLARGRYGVLLRHLRQAEDALLKAGTSAKRVRSGE